MNMPDSSTIIIIPARGGSKRVPRKNVKPLLGKPLICWTIEAAIEAKLCARIVITSDDNEILNLAQKYAGEGVVARKRPNELATDRASTVDAIVDVLESEEANGNSPETVVLLQPTSPLRNADDIIESLHIFNSGKNSETVVSVCEAEHPTAWLGYVKKDKSFIGTKLLDRRSQDHRKEYRLNGAVYVASAKHIISKKSLFTGNLLASLMPRSRSIDIDEEVDFKICEGLLLADN